MIKMIKDFLGKELKFGQTIIYSKIISGMLFLEKRIVTEIGDNFIRAKPIDKDMRPGKITRTDIVVIVDNP